MSALDDKHTIMRQVERIEGSQGSLETEADALANFARLLNSVVAEEALATVVGDRVHAHLENYAQTRRMLDLQGVTELMYVAWTEGFLAGHGYTRERITGERT